MVFNLEIKRATIFILLIYSTHSLGQSKIYSSIDNLRKKNLDELRVNLSKIDDYSIAYKAIFLKYKYLEKGKVDNSLVSEIEESLLLTDNKLQKSISMLILGDFYLLTSNKSDSISIKFYSSVFNYAKNKNDSILTCEALRRLTKYYSKKRKYHLKLFKKYLEFHKEYSYDDYELLQNSYYRLYYKMSVHDTLKNNQDRILFTTKNQLLEDEINKALESDATYLSAKLYQLYGVKLFYQNKDFKKADSLYEIAINLYNAIPYSFSKKESYNLLMNRGSVLFKNKEYNQAKKILLRAKKLVSQENRVSLNRWLQDVNYKLREIDSTYLYANKRFREYELLESYKHAKAISEINTKYQTAEKDKENAELKADKAQTNTFLTISLSILALVIISAYLIQKNTRKKQLLAEQAKDLEEQKVSTLLKEQELSSIDAMIEGQEKERKRIAEDLHDDLGALMATVKLHFDNIETAQNEDAVKKTSSLLDEAYNKIRTIAHAKNAGVIANQGLLVAVTNMASKISSSNTLDIEVVSFGLEERLENSLELSLFRMIQELIANIIKHAEASNATIQLTQHFQNLNIIVEDNGKGFETDHLKDAGIGLENIKKRIDHLDGKLTIDSTLKKGTTILIDVPLN